MARWDKDELSAKSLLTQKIPDSTLMRIHAKTLVRERWEAIVKEYTEKGAYAQTNLRVRFLETKCPEKSNVREFLDNLRVKREELASVGVDIDEKDYRSTILSSLPTVLANFASSQLAAARMFSPDKMIMPDVLISLISEEYERQKTQRTRRSGGKGKDEADEAMSVGSSSKSRRSGSSKSSDWKSKVTCWNCGEKGHFKDKCPKPPKDSSKGDGKGKSKSEGSREKSGGAANAVDSDSDGVFAVSCETEDEDESDNFYVSTAPTSAHVPSDADSMLICNPSVQPTPSLIRNLSRTSSASKIRTTKMKRARTALIGSPRSRATLEIMPMKVGDDADAESEIFEELEPDSDVFSATSREQEADLPRVEILDSGTTRHISPYHDDFETLSEIPQRSYVLQIRAIQCGRGKASSLSTCLMGWTSASFGSQRCFMRLRSGTPWCQLGVSTRWVSLPRLATEVRHSLSGWRVRGAGS